MRYTVHLTANFDRNLEELRDFLERAGAVEHFGRLLDRLFDDLIPNLASHPRLGRDFLAHAARSAEAELRLARLRRKAGADTEIREYILDDYLVLYAIRARRVVLLAIKHHRQLSFDLRGHWSAT